MDFVCEPSELSGAVAIPASKSHTIRALLIGTLADGESLIHSPLHSQDAYSAVQGAEALGGCVNRTIPDEWRVQGTKGELSRTAEQIDVGNSGTTLRMLMSMCALLPEEERIVLTGDEQIQRRPAEPLLQSLQEFGAYAVSVNGNGCAPLEIGGCLSGGSTSLEAVTSQYLSSLLLACPLAGQDTEINVTLLNEPMYVDMTLAWLREQGIAFEYTEDKKHFNIPGNQGYRAFSKAIPADFSSATFMLGAGAIQGNDITCQGLDITDPQPDRAVVDFVEEMGAQVTRGDREIRVAGNALKGASFDMNGCPDALPVMAVLGCFASGTTTLYNVHQARLKETDRIAVMTEELGKMGALIEEREDGLIVKGSELSGAEVDGHKDHRVVMALALAGMQANGTTRISGSEAAGITYPDFAEHMRQLGAQLKEEG